MSVFGTVTAAPSTGTMGLGSMSAVPPTGTMGLGSMSAVPSTGITGTAATVDPAQKAAQNKAEAEAAAAEAAAQQPEAIVNSFSSYTGLSKSISQQFFDIFDKKLSRLIMNERGAPPLTSWGRDDWITFIDTYFKDKKSTSAMDQKILTLKVSLYSFLKDSAAGEGELGMIAAQKRLTMDRFEQQDEMAKGSAIGPMPAGLMPAGPMPARATNSSIDIRPITIAVNNLNTTINKLLTAIESRLKKNDVNSQLKKMTEFISEINDSLPAPTEGGGTRRANMKKRKKTLRSGRHR